MDSSSKLEGRNVDRLNAIIDLESRTLRDKLRSINQTARQVFDEVETIIENPVSSLMNATDPGAVVRERPLAAVAVGLCLGWVAGMLLPTGERRKDCNLHAEGNKADFRQSSRSALKDGLIEELEQTASQMLRAAFKGFRSKLETRMQGNFTGVDRQCIRPKWHETWKDLPDGESPH